MMPSEEEESDAAAAAAAAAAGPAINDDAKNNNVAGEGIIVTEADKSAGPPPPTNEKMVLSHAVLKECMTVLSPLTLLPEEACRRSRESLQNRTTTTMPRRKRTRARGEVRE